MAEADAQQSAPVVQQVQTKKLKIDGKKVAYLNAFALSFAAFFGVALIFNAIASLITTQTKKGSWSFGIPFGGLFTAWDIALPTNFILAFMVLVFGIIGLVTVNKITDADALKKAWKCNHKVFFTLTALYALSLVATAIYSLINIKKGAGTTQKHIWLDDFLPTVIMAGVSFFIAFMSKSIAAGKTALVRVMSYISLCIASIAFIMIFVDYIVEIHSKKSYSGSSLDDLDDVYEGLNDLYDFLN